MATLTSPGMARLIARLSLCAFLSAPLYSQDEIKPLTESTIVEVINSVNVLTGENLDATPAETEMLFKAPDFLETGRRSRARLEADDGTITRIGSNTLFSFDDASRTINLKRGSLLFHSPEGRGGGRVVTASATASVLGTTIMVAATPDGGFKLLVLEGVAQVAYPDGTFRRLNAGQMTFVLPEQSSSSGRGGQSSQGGGSSSSGGSSSTSGGSSTAGTSNPTTTPPQTGGATGTPGAVIITGQPGPVVNFDLSRMQEGSALLNGFEVPLPSAPLIDSAINRQRQRIRSGELLQTGARVVDAPSPDLLNIISDNLQEGPGSSTTPPGESNPLLPFEVNSDGELVTVDEFENNPTNLPLDERLAFALQTSINPSVDGFPEENLFGFPGVALSFPAVDEFDEQFPELIYGFLAGNISVGSGPLNVSDIGISIDGANFTEFNMLAIDNFRITGDLRVGGFGENAIINLFSLGTLQLASGSDLVFTSESPSVAGIGSFEGATFNDSGVRNNNGSLSISTITGDLIFRGAEVAADGALPSSASPFEGDVVNQLSLDSDSAALRILGQSTLRSTGSIFLNAEEIEIDNARILAEEDIIVIDDGDFEALNRSVIEGRDIILDVGGSALFEEASLMADGQFALSNFGFDDNQAFFVSNFPSVTFQSSILEALSISIESAGLINIFDSEISAQNLIQMRSDSEIGISDISSEKTFQAGLIELSSNGNLSISDAHLEANTQRLDLSAQDHLDISARSNLRGQDVFLASEAGDISIDNSRVTSNDNLQIRGQSLVTIDASTVAADFIEVNADTIKSELTQYNTNRLELIAANEIALNQIDLRDLNNINMAARTLTLSNLRFSSNSEIRLGSETGTLAPRPNTGQGSVTGYVNFIENVTLDGSPAQNYVSAERGGNAEEVNANAAITLYSTSNSE